VLRCHWNAGPDVFARRIAGCSQRMRLFGHTAPVSPELPTATVVVATYLRPDHVGTCLEHLSRQTTRPHEVIVVDASPDARTEQVVSRYPGVRYLRNPRGAGTLATSRAIALEVAGGEVIAFLDDDAYARPDWLEHLLRPYLDERVAAVGGRALNGQKGEETAGVGEIGRLREDGRLTGHFAAHPGGVVDVDHMLGANMSFRRSVACELGGIHDYYPGTCLREDADMPLRMRLAGHRVVYMPDAVVEHVAGPYARGRRFDLRYDYYGQRNHLVLLSRTVGVRSPYFRHYLRSGLREISQDLGRARRSLVDSAQGHDHAGLRGVGGGVSRAAVKVAGLMSGGVQVVRLRMSEGPLPPRAAGGAFS